MILYHGTNMDFEAIDITRSNPYKDFGKGFYLTDIRKQAEELAKDLESLEEKHKFLPMNLVKTISSTLR